MLYHDMGYSTGKFSWVYLRVLGAQDLFSGDTCGPFQDLVLMIMLTFQALKSLIHSATGGKDYQALLDVFIILGIPHVASLA